MSDRVLPERREIKRVLRATGLSSRQTDALLRSGWRGLVGQSQAEIAELHDRLDSITRIVESHPPQG